jgi:colanic acid biosynthesis glycosyl transferase WcaI
MTADQTPAGNWIPKPRLPQEISDKGVYQPSNFIHMRVLTIGINYWPEETGIGPVTTWRCEYLASRGHDVTVCTTFPYYPQWRVHEPYRNSIWKREERKGVTILRSCAWMPSRVSPLKRILFEASFLACNLVRTLSARKPELIWVVSPPLGLAVTAKLLSQMWGVPFAYDVMDLQPDAAAELGMLRSGALLRTLYRLERFAYEHAELISTLTEGMRQRIIAKSISPQKVTLFPLCTEHELFLVERGTGGQEFRRTQGLESKFIVAHSGNMGIKQGLDVVLRAAEMTRSLRDIVYLLVGDGAIRPDLESLAAAKHLTNIKFLPLLPREQYLQLLAAADLSLITQRRSVADIVFPSKTATLMTAGCPILASVNSSSEVARIIMDSGAGLVVTPEDPASLVAAVTNLERDPAKLREMGEAGRRYAREHWDEDRTLPRMESELLRAASLTRPRRPAAIAREEA